MNKLLLFLTLTTTIFCSNQGIESELDSYVKAYVNQGLFSGSILVAKDGKVLLYKGYGMANYELDVPNTPQTKFRLGSVTKQFTGMAIMQLQEVGLLQIDDTVSKYIHDYPRGDEITIHHLLTHTSGIPDIRAFSTYEKKKIKPHTLDQLIERFKNKPLDFEPGEKYKYSNSGYVLLSYIIEKASGKKYETVLKEYIFDPLGIRNTGYDHHEAIIKNRASGYSIVDDKIVNATYIDMSFPAGAGALYSTIEDLYLWDQALYSEKLLSKESLAKIFTTSHGYGWAIDKVFNHNWIGASGEIEGFTTNISRYPDDKICIIVLNNYCDRFSTSRVSNGLAAIVFGEKYELPKKRLAVSVDPAIYDQYIGKYRVTEDFIITITKDNNRLFAQGKHELYPESETEFFHKDIDIQLSFFKDKDGKITQLILHRGCDKDQVAEKIN